MARTYGGVPPEQRRAERRERLLTAALELFTSVGFRQAKITQLCTRAGVSTRNFYEEFGSKEEVLRTLHDQINSLALRHVAAALDQFRDADAMTRIARLLDVFVATVTLDPRMPRLNYVEAVGVSPELELQHQVWVDRWATFIEQEARRAAEAGAAPDRNHRDRARRRRDRPAGRMAGARAAVAGGGHRKGTPRRDDVGDHAGRVKPGGIHQPRRSVSGSPAAARSPA